ncbi:alpha/beta fold hydrolase [Arhodomonas sp. AD133]|uniref:alpha/beta fold hydrolase n=1 Tax=Arhodomonas sp. AD133 TaxID=3415009 RepID=UPI003EC0EAC1
MSGEAVRFEGTGSLLVVVHGWAMAPEAFGAWRERLTARYRVAWVTLPGHGQRPDTSWTPESAADEVVAALPAPAVWLGWSLGAQIALAAAQRHPAAVRGLLPVAATPSFVTRSDWPCAVRAPVLRRMRRRLAEAPAAVAEAFAREVAEGPAPAAGGGVHALDDGLRWLGERDWRPVLQTIDVPARWVIGSADPLVPAAASRAAAEAMPGGACLELAGAGHMPFIHHPAIVEDALAELFAEDS